MKEKKRKTLTGVVHSDKMDKTVSVRLLRTHRHPMFGKVIRAWSKVYAHDAENKCHEGDTVKIEEMRPLSKLKRWRVVDIIN